MLTLFWDMEGTILLHFTPKRETVNRFPYVWLNERSSKKKERVSSDEVAAKLVKDASKKLFSDN
jgi:hypothetical protein